MFQVLNLHRTLRISHKQFVQNKTKFRSNNNKRYISYQVDHLVIGAGVVGLAIGAQLSKHSSTLVVEKNFFIGEETSSRNSEVIHAGIYYPLDSLKTELCIKGRNIIYHICDKYNIPHKRIGKWIIASDNEGAEYLQNLKRKSDILGVRTLFIDEKSILYNEPNINALHALSSPDTGIIDSASLMSFYENIITHNGSNVSCRTKYLSTTKKSNYYSSQLIDLNDPNNIVTIDSKFIINCAGLYAARISDEILKGKYYHTHYCKGHYYSVQGKSLISRLIYPIPDKNLESLGIHTTLDLSGKMKLGPDVQYIDNIDYSFEDDDNKKQKFYRTVKQYLPSLNLTKMTKDYCGIRPKLAGPGEPFKDFIIQEESEKGYPGVINLIGIESPGLTASPSIANMVAKMPGYSKIDEYFEF